MFDIPLFPERASTIAGEVDALYFFLVGLSGFFALLIATRSLVLPWRKALPAQETK